MLLGLGFATLVAPQNDMPCIQAKPELCVCVCVDWSLPGSAVRFSSIPARPLAPNGVISGKVAPTSK